MTFLRNKENYENLYWGVKNLGGFCLEKRDRESLILLGDNSVGRMFTRPVKLGVLGCMPNYWGSNQEVNCYLLGP